MIKNIINQQREECRILAEKSYVNRLNGTVISDYRATQLIKLITGPRRSGKSVLALQILKGANFAYLNFDDDLLLKHFDEDNVMQALSEIYGDFEFLLLDEIQNLQGWELWINKLYRRDTNLIVTGSNAKLLSRELATSLTGRYIQIPVFPFSFSEYLQFFDIHTPHQQNDLTPTETGELLNQLHQYLYNGGFPEALMNPAFVKNYLQSLFDSILLKDVLKRFRIRQTQQLFDLANYFLANYANPYSANELKGHLAFNSVATVQKFVSYLEEPFLFLNLTRYSNKLKMVQKAPKKVYVIDNGFIKAGSFELSPNQGRLLENLVFVELLRRNYEPELTLFYYRSRNDKEVDFVCRKGHQFEQLIQVCYDISNPKTLKRETEALLEASSELKNNNLIIITWDKSEVLEKEGKTIALIPAYKWLLSPNAHSGA